jgi:1,4-alpha-glucan branching enzyme
VHPIRSSVASTYDSDRDMDSVRNAILYQYSGDAMARVIYTESHDEVANGSTRLPEEICPGCADSWAAKKRSTLGAAVLMASPGVPMLFQGQEFLEDGWWSDDVPLDWGRADTFSGILQMYKDLIACRRNFWGQTEGLRGSNTNVFHQNNTDKMIAWHRWQNGGGGDDVVVAANFSVNGRTNYRIGLPGPGTWYVRFNSDSVEYDSSFSNWATYPVTAEEYAWDGMQWSAEISIGPYTAVYFSQ